MQLVLVKWGRMVELLVSDLLANGLLSADLVRKNFPLLSIVGLLQPSLVAHHV